MARKLWSELSDSYRTRLAKAGVTRNEHDNPNFSLAKARGHSKTPEHPDQKYQPRFKDYFKDRQQLETRVISKKRRLFGKSGKWKGSRSAKYVREGKDGKKPSAKLMKRFLSPDFDLDEVDWTDDRWAFLYYH
jgi:hypothetical protein